MLVLMSGYHLHEGLAEAPGGGSLLAALVHRVHPVAGDANQNMED